MFKSLSVVELSKIDLNGVFFMNKDDILFEMKKDGLTVVFFKAPAFNMVGIEIKGHNAFIQGIDLLNAVEIVKTGNTSLFKEMWTYDGFKTLLMEFGLI